MSSRTQTPRSVAARTRAAVAGALTALLSVAFVVVAAVPASAAEGLGEKQGWDLSAAELTLLFIGVPVVVFAIVIALVYGTSRKSEPRLREGQDWWSAPNYHAAGDAAATPDTRATSSRTTDGGGAGANW